MKGNYNKRILLVEDEPITAQIQLKKIQGFGYETVSVCSGEDALQQILEDIEIDLILMDVDLGSGMDGPETAQRILSHRAIPIVFLTSHSEREMVEKVRGITRYGYVIKNSGDFVLQSSIEMAFDLFEAHRDIESRMGDLQKSQHLVNMALQGTDQGIWEFDLNSGKITYDINWEKILGFKSDDIEFNFDWWKSRMHPDSYVDFETALTSYMDGKVKHLEWEYQIQDKSGSWQWIHAMGVFDKRDTLDPPARLIGTHWNITDQKKAKEQEENRNRAFRMIHEYSMELAYLKYEELFPGITRQINMLFNARGAIITLYDEKTHNLVVHYTTLSDKENSSITKLLGKNLLGFKVPVSGENYKLMTETIVGEALSLHQLTFGAMPEILSRPIEKIFGLGAFIPVVLLHKSTIVGTMVVILRPGQAIPDREVMLAFAGITANALERGKAEADLRQSEGMYRYLTNNIPDIIYSLDGEGKIVTINDSALERFGHKEETSIGKPFLEYIHPEDREIIIKSFLKALEEKRTETRGLQFRLLVGNGLSYWFELNARARFDKGGKYLGEEGVLRDITERKVAEEKLRQSEERFKFLVEKSYDPIWILRGDGVFTYVSPSWESVLGYDPSFMIDKFFQPFVHPDDVAVCENYMLNVLEAGKGLPGPQYRVRHVDDTWRWHEGTITPVYGGDGSFSYFVGISRDITDRKEAVEALKGSEKRAALQRTFLSELLINQALYGGDLTAALERIVKFISDTLGVARASVWTLSDDGSELICRALYNSNKGTYSCSDVLKTADLPVYFEAMAYGNRIYVDDALNDPRTCELADPYLKPQGITSLLDTGFFIDGKLAGVVCSEHVGPMRKWFPDEESFISTAAATVAQIFIEIERKKAEHEIKKQLSEKEILLKEVHHRVKNNISNIEGLLILQLEESPNSEVKSALQDALSRVQSIRILYDKLLLGGDYQDISIKEYIESLIDSLAGVFHTGVKVTIEKHIPEFTVASKTAIPLGIIINELLTNVYKYAFNGRSSGRVSIVIEKNEDYASLIIHDNGIGINEEIESGKTSGFGLTIVGMLAHQLKGSYFIVNDNGTKSVLKFQV